MVMQSNSLLGMVFRQFVKWIRLLAPTVIMEFRLSPLRAWMVMLSSICLEILNRFMLE